MGTADIGSSFFSNREESGKKFPHKTGGCQVAGLPGIYYEKVYSKIVIAY